MAGQLFRLLLTGWFSHGPFLRENKMLLVSWVEATRNGDIMSMIATYGLYMECFRPPFNFSDGHVGQQRNSTKELHVLGPVDFNAESLHFQQSTMQALQQLFPWPFPWHGQKRSFQSSLPPLTPEPYLESFGAPDGGGLS